MERGSEEGGNEWTVPEDIGEMVQTLRNYLKNDSYSFKGTMKILSRLEDKIPLLRIGNLNVKTDKEEERAVWLREVKAATEQAKKLVQDMDHAQVTYIRSNDHNLVRMKYTIGRLLSVCSKGESIIDMPNLDKDPSEGEKEHTSEFHGRRDAKSLLDDDFLVGRDEEIAMIRNMVLDNAHYVAAPTSLEFRKKADQLHISQKGWITETLQKIDLSKRTPQATEVSPYLKNEMGNKVEYIHVPHNSTVTYLRNPAVIPIVGISGVGKSALAQFIFNDENVREYFGDRSAWVYMADRINQLDMIRKIIYSFDPKYGLSNVINLESAHIELQNVIEGKRFLLVLDDLWDISCMIWNSLRSVLSKGAPGSVVLVTTQLYSVADLVGTAGPVILDPLQTDGSWTLLKSYAFIEPCRSLSTEGLEETGRKIARRLPGLPLAIKVIGATLRSKLEEAHWGKLLNSWWWNISDDSFAIRVISSLGSCYIELPGYLRQCFVYCSIFPRNYVFEKDELVQMWIADGFIQLNSSTGAKRLEDVAGEWFDELVDSAFLQPSACKTGYIMHDLVWEFASALSSNEYHSISNKLRGVSQDVCYLSIGMEDLNALPGNFNIKQLRTIMLIGDVDQPSSNEIYLPLVRILNGSISLRLLAFSSCSLGAAIANGLSALKHLRYLDLSFTGIKRMPDSVCSLWHLQVLGLRGCTFDELPTNMNWLINLRHLHASSDTIAQINGIGKLTKLQELHEYRVKAEDGHRITELSDMNDLRGSLCISDLEMVTDPAEALKAKIVEKNYITALELRWYGKLPEPCRSDLPSLLQSRRGNLGHSPVPGAKGPLSNKNLHHAGTNAAVFSCLSPPRYLQDLKLYGYSGFEFPDWVGQLKHVRVVEISSCKNLKVLPPLGQLEHLQKLKLVYLMSIKYIDYKFCGTSNVVFRSLEELTFEGLEALERWTYGGSSKFIANLQKLRISSCHNLSQVPFESLGSATKELFLDMHSLDGDTISRYLKRLTGLTRLVVLNHPVRHILVPDITVLILPCKQMRSLEYVHIDGFTHVLIKGGLWFIRNLKDLRITSCHTIGTFGEEPPHEEKHVPTQQCNRVNRLTLATDSMDRDLEKIVRQIPTVRTLHLTGATKPTSITEDWSFPQLTSLQELELCWCNVLPSSLASLSSLKRFTLKSCPDICSIPPNRLPGNLKELRIMECSVQLEARCQNPNGEVWQPEKRKMERRRWTKIDEWQRGKVEYGRRKLIEMQKKEEQTWLMSADEQLQEEEPLDEWLQPSRGEKRPERRWEMDSWVSKKLNEALISDKKGSSSLKKEREELLAKEEHELYELYELVGKDWPNIAHVPYIHVEGKIVQNLYT